MVSSSPPAQGEKKPDYLPTPGRARAFLRRVHAAGTRFTYDHTGFTGPGGFIMAKLLGSVRKKMLTIGLPAVLDDLDDTGALRPASTLRAKPAT